MEITGYGNGAIKTVYYGKFAAVKKNTKVLVVKGYASLSPTQRMWRRWCS